jgi:hypothetical protein
VERFKTRCLNPLLEQLVDWWGWVKHLHEDPFTSRYPTTDPQKIHWQHPFGVYNVLDEGGSSDLDEYLDTGSEVGLKRVETLFPELDQ